MREDPDLAAALGGMALPPTGSSNSKLERSKHKEQLVVKDKHLKASDIANNAQSLFAKKVNSFQEAYPSIKAIRVEVEEMDYNRSVRTTVCTEGSFRHAIDCNNPLCYGGGITIGWIIHEMMAKESTDLEDQKLCQGYEGSPKGRRRDRSCMHLFKYKVHVEYFSNAGGSTPAL